MGGRRDRRTGCRCAGRDSQAEAQRALDAAVALVPGSIPVTKLLSRDPIRDALAKQLHAGRYDLLVMGSRGRGAVSSSLLGSVSHYALNHSRIPILIVHADSDAAGGVEAPGAVLGAEVDLAVVRLPRHRGGAIDPHPADRVGRPAAGGQPRTGPRRPQRRAR